MGKSLDQILSEAGEDTKVTVTVVTNQDNLVASYARGTLIYHPPALVVEFLEERGYQLLAVNH